MALETITISDPTTGARARIAPGLGFNCYSFEPSTLEGPLEVLWSAPEFSAGTAKPSGSGIPLLFPFAGRIRGAAFDFAGKTYALLAGDGLGNAIHGFVISRPWRITQQSADRVTGQFQASIDDPSLLRLWPADFRITAEYRLTASALSSEFLIENPDEKPLPFWFGTHGYFRVPLGTGSTAQCSVQVPVKESWVLEKLLPTGRQESPRLAAELSQGMPVDSMRLDHVFGGLHFDNHRCTTKVEDTRHHRVLALSFDDQFLACVVFNPSHREAICIEPYTAIPDAFTLQAQGIHSGLRVLPAGQSFRTSIDLRLVTRNG
jgi:aldose 1-epimerase